ncbi:MAG: M56 family metallopeptidase [Prevotella sp.]|nr:M56 family metallopeptidase [Prevotella sp.]
MASFLIYIIRWAVVLTMLYSLYGLFMKRETLHGFNRVVLLSILVVSMVLPLVQVETRHTNLMTQGREQLEQRIILLEASAPGSTVGAATPLPTRIGVGEGAVNRNTLTGGTAIFLLFVLIYIIGVAIAWIHYLWSIVSLLRLIRQGRPIPIGNLPKSVKVLVHPAIKTPCSWMRWVLLSPADAELFRRPSLGKGLGVDAPISSGETGRGLLRHELAHIHYGHSWDMLLCELTCRMLWPVPFAWMLRQDLRDVHEFQADRRVLKSGIDENEYQLLLIRKATGTGLQPVVNALNQSPIKRRFKMMYKKPSRRWVALKATYLLPLSALAIVAFARPETMGVIEKHVENSAPTIAEAIKTVARQLPSLTSEAPRPCESVIRQQTEADVQLTTPGSRISNSSEPELPDSNLVAADLRESDAGVLGASSAKTPLELLDSTMQAVGARKIADGTYVGHFQPTLNSDTVRIATLTVRDRESQPTGEHRFAQHTNHPFAYNITLNAETRKERRGYYIRYLQPASSTLRNYDQKPVDPKLLSTDSVLTGRSSNDLPSYTPIAIQQNKKETRLFMYTWLSPKSSVDALKEANVNFYKSLAIVDEGTGDKYVCRSIDYSYFKYMKDEYVGQNREDTVKVYQVCLVFPPLSKRVKEFHFGSIEHDDEYYNTYDLENIPRKGKIITK